ncbi:BUD22-domain-containing protein [Apiosordaria backusii]|uniref:BUD22-domain-containing protein n=1 Tax=Apiosordaria backusii TaxID=314023 RepID=A0AA40DKG7_9PEZI|nr:BUD22-domain-containing protein [Apiosordaria backusii]
MVKRKRGDEESSLNVSAVFFRHRDEVFRAIKNAKGRERQRQSKRLKDAKSTPDKKARIEKEIVVLNSLDLHQTAHAHLCSSLLRFKSIAEHERLPTEIKGGVPKPELTEEEKTALHNVTSALYSYAGKKEKTDSKEEVTPAEELKKAAKEKEDMKGKKAAKENDEKKDKKEKEVKQKKPKEVPVQDGDEGEEDEGINYGDDVDEKVVSRMADLLGSSSEDEDEYEAEKLALAKRQSKTKTSPPKDLDPMEITSDEEGGDEADSDDGSDLDPMEITDDEAGEQNDDEGSDEFAGFSDSNQISASDDDSDGEDGNQQSDSSSSSSTDTPPPKKTKKAPKVEVNGSTFLPSLMGGYISGSESASDVDIAPTRKNRRGQRARQAIWEKKFKEQAKHLKEQQNKRDAGWDLKRGAVDGDNKPWKKGIKNPFKATGANDLVVKKEEPPKKDRARDDLGTLHPSWEARRLAKEKEKLTAPFQGKKITFD